jgi:hypothetical protein
VAQLQPAEVEASAKAAAVAAMIPLGHSMRDGWKTMLQRIERREQLATINHMGAFSEAQSQMMAACMMQCDASE